MITLFQEDPDRSDAGTKAVLPAVGSEEEDYLLPGHPPPYTPIIRNSLSDFI